MRFLENGHLSGVVEVMLDDPVEEVVDRPWASGHGFIERGIAGAGFGVQLGNSGGQPLVRRVQLTEKVSPRC